MINELTKEQEEYLPIFRQKYLNAATDCKRIDRSTLQAAIDDAYNVINKAPPMLIILQFAIFFHIISPI